jgi:DNA-binding response OmpR family regulator
MFSRSEIAVRERPCLILAQTDPLYADLVRRTFHGWGWEVRLASAGVEARKLAADSEPALVVMDADLPGESGWLTCAKLTSDMPNLRVILISDRMTRGRQRFAAFVGAANIVARRGSLQALLCEAREAALPAVG